MSVPAWIAVGLLGGVAAAARLAIDAEIVARADSEFPLVIFVVNVSGALALGVVAGLALDGAALTILAGDVEPVRVEDPGRERGVGADAAAVTLGHWLGSAL